MKTGVRQETTERFQEMLGCLLRDSYSSLLDEWQSLDVTITQARIIDILDRLGPMRMSTLASQAGHTLSATTSLMDRLAGKGLIQRQHADDDRRAVLCELSPAGRIAQRRLSNTANTWLGQRMNNFSKEQIESIIESFEMLCGAAPRHEPTTEHISVTN